MARSSSHGMLVAANRNTSSLPSQFRVSGLGIRV
jgi:hypothetical protein